MAEFKTNKATIRIHGTVNRENLEVVTKKFMKKVVRCRKNKQKK